jgi:hypothetical protein
MLTARRIHRRLPWAAGLVVALVVAGCGGEEKPPPGPQDVDAITAATARIVVACRSVERGFVTGVDAAGQRKDVDTLVEAAGDFDPDAAFRLPDAAVDPESTLRDQAELALARLEEGCAPEEGQRLREALGG